MRFILLLFLPFILFASVQKISLQLNWKHQFEFAGFYAAKEKGFYKDVGLDLEIKEYAHGINTTNDVLNTKSTFGTASSILILEKLKNKPVVLIGSYFKKNTLAIVASKNIKNLSELKNKKIMALEHELNNTSLGVMLKENNIKKSDYTLVKHDFNVEKFINGEVDAMSVFISNELFQIKKSKKKYNLFLPSDFGIYSYDSELFTSQKIVKKSPRMVKNFIEATNKGWEYAFAHKDEIIDLIYKKYTKKKSKEALLFEANATEKLFKINIFKIGSIVPELVGLNAVVFKKLGLIDKNVDTNNLLQDYIFYNLFKEKENEKENDKIINLTKQEREFLAKNKVIKVHMENNYLPFSNISSNNKFIGYSIDYANMIAKKIGVEFSYNKNEDWSQAVENLKAKRTDIVAQMINTKERHSFALFSDDYMKFYRAIIVKKENLHLNSIDKLKSKRVGVVKGYISEKLLLKNYPSIEIVPFSGMNELLKNIYLGNVDAGIGTHRVAQHNINNFFLNKLISLPILNNPHFPRIYEAFGIRKDWSLMHSSIQKALKSVTAQEISSLEIKWFGSKLTNEIKFTKKEKEFIAKQKIIKVGNDSYWPPFDFYENDKAKGFNIDYLKEISSLTGLKFEFVQDKDWKALIDRFKNRDIDILTAFEPTTKRKKYTLFSDDILMTFESMITRLDYTYPKSYKDLYGKKVGIIEGYDFQEEIQNNHKEIDLILFKKPIEALQALSDSKIDVFVENTLVIRYLISKYFLTNLHVGASPNFPNIANGDKIKIASRSDYPELHSIIQKAIKFMPEKTKKELHNKWMYKRPDKETKIELTTQENEYLNNNKITMCVDPDWMPFEKLLKGKHIGMSADYFKIIEKKLDSKIDIIQTSTWKESIQFAKQRKCDLLSLAMETPLRKEYMNFTSPYLSVPLVFTTKTDVSFIADFNEIKNKKVGITNGYAFVEILRKKYPNIDIVEVANMSDGLNKVKNSELFGYIGTLASIGYAFQTEFTGELKITGKFDETWELGIAVRNDDKTLFSIMQKAVSSIDKVTQRAILNKWIAIKYEKGIDYTLVWQIVFIAILIILATLFWLRKVSILNQQLKLAKDKADETTQLKANFLANMSHEIRTPMNSIVGMTYLVKETNLSEIQYDYIKKIENSSNNLLKLLNEILDYSKLEANKLKINKSSFNLLELINNIENLLKIKISEKAIEFKITYDKSISMHLYGDKLRLSQVLTNLLTNAVKFTNKGKVELFVTKINEKRFKFEVVDTGIGLKEEEMTKIFSSFTQVDNSSTRSYEGTGLGLAIAKELISLMGGEISVKSIFGQGSSFSFEIELESSNKPIYFNKELSLDNNAKNIQIKKEFDEQKIKELFTKLKDSTQKRRPQLCEPILKEFENYILDDKSQKLFDSVNSLIRSYKFNEAGELL